jgi:hypothetical protein
MGLRGKSLLDPVMACAMDGTAEAEKSKDLTQRTQRGHRDQGDIGDEIRPRLRVILL